MKPCPLPEQVRWSDNCYDGRDRPVLLATLHESVGGTEATSLALFCERAGVSYHAIADNEKMIYTVPRSKGAWALRNGNMASDNLCLTSPVEGYSRSEWLGPQKAKVDVAAWWLAMVCADRGVNIHDCSYQEIRDALAGHREAGGCTTHNNYTQATHDGTHTDPRNFPMDLCVLLAQEYASAIKAPVSNTQQTLFLT